jgi:hypothetical protein
MNDIVDVALHQLRKPLIKAIIVIADLAVVFVGLACVALVAVFPRFAEADADQWERIKANAWLGWQIWLPGLLAVFVLGILTSLCGPKYWPWAGALFAFWLLLILPMAVGTFLIGPQDMRIRHLIAAKEKSGLKHNDLAAACLALRRQGFRGEVPRSAWPAGIAALKPNYMGIGEDEITVQLYGGFDHFGYKLEKSSDGKNWSWQWYTETEGGEELAKIPVDPKLDR